MDRTHICTTSITSLKTLALKGNYELFYAFCMKMEGTEQTLQCIDVVNKKISNKLMDLKDKHIYISQCVSKVS